jgi:hypothetical protein
MDKWRKAVEQAQADAEAVRAEAELLHTRAEKDIALVRREVDAARHAAMVEAEQLRTAAAQAERAFVARFATAEALQERQITEVVERTARLADSVQVLDEAGSLSDVLERLVQCVAPEVDRAAMLIVKGYRMTGWRLAGFSADASSAKAIDLRLEEAGLAGAVVESGMECSRPADAIDGVSLPPFAVDSRERHAMAFPVHVGGEVVAVLYADVPQGGDSPSSDARWPAILRILVRHASRVLEAMTVQRAAGLPAQRPVHAYAVVPHLVEHAGSG